MCRVDLQGYTLALSRPCLFQASTGSFFFSAPLPVVIGSNVWLVSIDRISLRSNGAIPAHTSMNANHTLGCL